MAGGRGRGRAASRLRAPWWAFVVDALLVLAFVLIGRSSHDENDVLGGVWITLWPFWSSLLIGWAIALGARRPLPSWPAGVIVWISTVLFGMVLRVVSQQGIAVSFIIVALIVLGVFVVGWRALVAGLARRAGRRRMRGSRA